MPGLPHAEPEPWEEPLLELARDGLGACRADPARPLTPQVRAAYDHCVDLVKRSSGVVWLTANLQGPHARRATFALYAFIRHIDNLADDPALTPEARRRQVEAWREAGLDDEPPAHQPIAVALADARHRFGMPVSYAAQFVQGTVDDIDFRDAADWSAWARRCYVTAATSCLMGMHMAGCARPDALLYAMRAGITLQLVNDLRDVGEDWLAGRCYLPRDEREAAGIDDAWLDAAARGDVAVTPAWRALMAAQISRARHIHRRAQPGMRLLGPAQRFGFAAVVDLYMDVLSAIEDHDHDVFTARRRRSWPRRLALLPGVAWRAYGPVSD